MIPSPGFVTILMRYIAVEKYAPLKVWTLKGGLNLRMTHGQKAIIFHLEGYNKKHNIDNTQFC